MNCSTILMLILVIINYFQILNFGNCKKKKLVLKMNTEEIESKCQSTYFLVICNYFFDKYTEAI